MIRGIAYILIFFFALQSCTIYNKTTVPIQDAVNKGKVKTIDSNGNAHRYSNITIDTDSVYYALQDKNSIPLFKELYSEGVYLKNREKSRTATIVVSIGVPVLGVFLIIVTAGDSLWEVIGNLVYNYN